MKNITCEIKKSLFIPFFCLSCVGVILVCLLSVGYTTPRGQNYMILELLLFLKRETMLTDVNLNRYEIWNRGIGTWTQLLLPFLLSIGYLSAISNEKQTGIDRLMLLREGNLKYSVSKAVSAMLSGGIIMLTGYFVFGLIVYVRFPSIHAYSVESMDAYLELYPAFNEMLLCMKNCVGTFMYGMSVNAFAFLVSILFMDKYILLCLPVMLKYIWGQAIMKIEINAINKAQDTVLNICAGLRPESILRINKDTYWVVSLVITLVIYILGICINMCILKKKGDGFGFE